MSRKAQALLELALFVGIMLMVLLMALSYQRNLSEQKLTDLNVFTQAKNLAYKHTFIEKDIDGDSWTCSGAIVSYSLNADRQANRLFQGGQRRTAASASSVYWSGAEDPPDLEFNYFNNTDIDSGETPKKIYFDRPGTENPEDGLKMSAADYFAAAYPALSSVAQTFFNIQGTDWWASWGGWLDSTLRAASAAYFVAQTAIALGKMDTSKIQRDDLKNQDEQMYEWGWRICDEVHDGASLAGKKYVKELTAQVYDIATEENKSINYGETQSAAPGYTSTRNVNVEHSVERVIQRRYDVTTPDPTIALADHTFETLPDKRATVDLGGTQNENWN